MAVTKKMPIDPLLVALATQIFIEIGEYGVNGGEDDDGDPIAHLQWIAEEDGIDAWDKGELLAILVRYEVLKAAQKREVRWKITV